MILGIFLLSLLFFAYLGFVRMADYLYLTKLTLFIGGAFEEKDVNPSFSSRMKDCWRYYAEGGWANILMFPIHLFVFAFVGVMSLFSIKGKTKHLAKSFVDPFIRLSEFYIPDIRKKPTFVADCFLLFPTLLEFVAIDDFKNASFGVALSAAQKAKGLKEQVKSDFPEKAG